MERNRFQTIGQILLVGGLTLLLGGVGWGSLAVVWAAPEGTAAAAQIGIQACPTNLSFSFTPVNPPAGEVVTFAANPGSPVGSGQITYTWNFGDGSAEGAGQSNVEHIYSLNGVYQVTLTATGDTCAPQPAPVTHLITVGFGAPAAIIYLPVMFNNYPGIIFPAGRQHLEPDSVGAPVQTTNLPDRPVSTDVRSHAE